MRVKIDALLDYRFAQPADVVLAVEAIRSADQRVVSDSLTVTPPCVLRLAEGPEEMGRQQWLDARGDVTITYSALVDVSRRPFNFIGLQTAALPELPADMIHYLMPSRYCEPDRLAPFAKSEFSGSSGGNQVLNMASWIYENFEYVPGSSNESTTAADTFLERRGVCRDYAHTLISFCRALGIPARMVSAYAPAIDPPDFHAVVEVWLEDGWHLIDPTRLSSVDNLVRIAVGRDATDISFMTIFGTAELRDQRVSACVVAPAANTLS